MTYTNCPHCFMPLNGGSLCRYCGNDHTRNPDFPCVIRPFTVLNNRYMLGRVLGKGGFGVTYIAMDLHRNMRCAIKEYMPSEYSTRMQGTLNVTPFSDDKARRVYFHGKEKYIEEARTLERLIGNKNVVTILDYFNENNTAYIVMEYLDGDDLRKQAARNGGKLDPNLAVNVLCTVSRALSIMHRQGILHRDISPENIIVTRRGDIKLLDFGSARNYVSSQKKGLSILLKQGYAPPEQYSTGGAQGPWSDVYALCATVYNLISGKVPVDALYRARGEHQPTLAELGCPVSKRISDVIERGMSIDYRARYKNFDELLKEVDFKMMNNYHDYSGNEPAYIPYVLSLSGGNPHGKMYIKPNQVVNIGRSSHVCQYVVSSADNISRIHCSLRFDGQRVYITDLSTNGTYFGNGKKLTAKKEYVLIPNTKFYLVSSKNSFILKV